jgi:hypothetical protein
VKYRIRNWAEFQHYKDRNPPWIKLHFELLSSADWVMLDDASRVLAVACMLLASRSGGEIDGSEQGLRYMKRVAYLNSSPDLSPLVQCGFLEPLADASTMQADARPETETETETDNTVDPWPTKPRKRGGNYLYPPPFERAWSEYPDRDGPNPKTGAYKAFRARVKSGDDPDDLIRAATHYRQHCQSRSKEGTPYVQQASTFWGPSEPWREFVTSSHANGKHKRRTRTLDPETAAEIRQQVESPQTLEHGFGR